MPTSVPMVAASLAERLQAIRKTRGLSQEELAIAASVTRLLLIKMEQNRHATPRLTTLMRLAAALDVDAIDLLAVRPENEQRPNPRDALERIAAALRVLRTEKGLSQEALSAELGRFRTFVPRLENHLVNPTLRDLEGIAQKFGVAVHTLLDEGETKRRYEKLEANKLKDVAKAPTTANETRDARKAREALKVSKAQDAVTVHQARKRRIEVSIAENKSPSDTPRSKGKKRPT